MLTRLGAVDELRKNEPEVTTELRLPQLQQPDGERDGLAVVLARTLRRMERRAHTFRLGASLSANLDLLASQFGLTKAERMVLAFAVVSKNDDVLHTVARHSRLMMNTERQVAMILGLTESQIESALSPQGILCKTGLIEVRFSSTPNTNVSLGLKRLRFLTRRRLKSIDEVFKVFLRPALGTTLCREDFAHLRPDFGFVLGMLDEALRSRRKGVNVLLHGLPGTGKTECSRLLAQELTASLFEVSFLDSDGAPQPPMRRLQNAAAAHFLLRGRRSLLLFDEIDAAFNDGSSWTGKPTTAESAKAWVNELLEHSPIPMIWIANRIDRMDPAFVRRFDLVIPMESPPLRQRERLLENLCGESLDPAQVRRFAQVQSATPAVVTRAVNVVRRVECTNHPRAELLEAVLDGTLIAQGHASVKRSCRGLPSQDYDVSLCNADADLGAIAAELAQSGKGRICLYGPPGTGKTAFGHWLAKTLDRPLVLKRASDIQSMWLGEMEKNLARAFEEAARDRAVLQIDEVDSFLQDRRNAERPWEISQTNEFLTQLESFDDVFVASTNLMDGLDRAALRRFDYKIRVDYMRPEQSLRLLKRMLHNWNVVCDDDSLAGIVRLSRLTPGDFAVVARRHGGCPFVDARAVLDALRREVGMRTDESRRIGFV
ncbi:MAG: ATP-binding protein [Acidobacteriota bacterium]|nr:ATP-binding protein [Acidobacteriota bacterium]